MDRTNTFTTASGNAYELKAFLSFAEFQLADAEFTRLMLARRDWLAAQAAAQVALKPDAELGLSGTADIAAEYSRATLALAGAAVTFIDVWRVDHEPDTASLSNADVLALQTECVVRYRREGIAPDPKKLESTSSA